MVGRWPGGTVTRLPLGHWLRRLGFKGLGFFGLAVMVRKIRVRG